jgi:hypothetical protein
MAKNDDLPDPLDDPETYAMMEKLFEIAMGRADIETEREMQPYVVAMKATAEGIMEATEGMTKAEADAFLDRWADSVLERAKDDAPKVQ